ncbi:MAG: preprotein translocase subunit YajC [Deltaproteobacteria bacterium]|nr:preprotein translocase subunit YajC [Deltaproteobacteria bacterium]
MFFTLAFAEGAAPAARAGAGFQQMIPLLLMVLIFYFLLIRPQMKKTKEHKAMLEALKVGDHVVTSGGVHGELKAITPDIVTLQLDDRVKIKVDRSAISRKTVSEKASS